MGTLNILNVARINNTKVIHTSTSEVYGTPLTLPINENHRNYAQSPYAASKIAADQLAISYFNSFDLPISIIRPFNTYGPRQSLRAVIPTIIGQLLDKKIKNVKLGNIYTTRDFNFIDDTVNGFIATINNKKINGEVINLGSSFEISIKKVFEIIKEITGINKKIYQEKSRIRPKKSELDRLYASNKKAKKLLSWKPKFSRLSGFKKGLKITIQWYKDNKSNYKNELYNL